MSAFVVDTECTSLDDDREVIELAWIRIPPHYDMAGPSDRIPLPLEGEGFLQRYKPSKPCGYGAIAVHHILPAELEGCPPSSEAAMPEDCVYMIGHSIDYDWRALGSPDAKRICTRAMAEHVWPDADSHSQSALIYMLAGPTPETRAMLKDAHSAAVDTMNNVLLLRAILEAKPDITTWTELHAFSEECRIPLIMPITDARGTPIKEIDDGLLGWCLRQYWLPDKHPYLAIALRREYNHRSGRLDL